VTGATGLVGSHAARTLAASGYAVSALVRDPAKLARVIAGRPGGEEVAALRGDVTDTASVAAALRGCEAVLHAAGLFSHHLADAERLRRVNVEGAATVLRAAANAGVARIVYVSSALALFPPTGPTQRASDPVASPRTMYAVTKAASERHARALQEAGAPISIVYPSSVLAPDDPTVGSGPGVMARMLRGGRVLVTEGGLAYTDARDLADLCVALFAAPAPPPRLMTTATFLSHQRYWELLRELTGRADLAARRIPGSVLRALGLVGDLVQRLGRRSVQLTSEAAQVLTRSVPVDDALARLLLRREPTPIEDSLRDTLVWMHAAGVLDARHVGRLAP
jgi:nucleoside-diphosphate-sugar epimerase